MAVKFVFIYRLRLRKRHDGGTADVSKGRMSPRVQRSLRDSTCPKVVACPVFLVGKAQSSVRVDAGVVVPDIKFNIYWRPHISERASL